jgi:hypothetical protein
MLGSTVHSLAKARFYSLVKLCAPFSSGVLPRDNDDRPDRVRLTGAFCRGPTSSAMLRGANLWNGSLAATTPCAATFSTAPPGSVWEEFKEGRWPKRLAKESIIAPEDFNRMFTVPGPFLIQISIGSVFAWSMWNGLLTRELGVVTSCAGDWALGHVVPVFSTAAITLGITTFCLGPWAEKAGPRLVGAAAAITYGGGCVVTSLGITLHSLPTLGMAFWAGSDLAWPTFHRWLH